MKISVASDHAGYELKEAIRCHLADSGHEIVDFGASSSKSTDYPDYGAPAARAVASGECERGVLVCGSGQGMVMVANKVRGVRAALAWHPEVARLSRIPSLKGLQTELVVGLVSPVSGLAGVLQQLVARLVYALDGIKDQKESSA